MQSGRFTITWESSHGFKTDSTTLAKEALDVIRDAFVKDITFGIKEDSK